jgi:hypothetical protein
MVETTYSVMGRHKWLFEVLLPAIEGGPEEICVIVFVSGLQRKWGNSTAGWTVPLGHGSVGKRLDDPRGSSSSQEKNEAAVAGCRELDASQRIK